MPDVWPRIHRLVKAEHEQEVRHWREALALSLDILRLSPQPNTFLGRPTYEPFPVADEEEE